MKSILLFVFIVCSVCGTFAGYIIPAGSVSQSNVSQSDSVLKGGTNEKGEDSLLLGSITPYLQQQDLQIMDLKGFTDVPQTSSISENLNQKKHYRLEALKEVCEFLFGSMTTLGGPIDYDALSLQLFYFTR